MLYTLYFSKVMHKLVVEYLSLGHSLTDFKLAFVWSSRVFRVVDLSIVYSAAKCPRGKLSLTIEMR